MENVIKLGNRFHMAVENSTDVYNVEDMLDLISLGLSEDVIKYRQGKKELSEQISMEINAITALSTAVKALS